MAFFAKLPIFCRDFAHGVDIADRDRLSEGLFYLRAGHRALLFSYGYGAHWTALAVEA